MRRFFLFAVLWTALFGPGHVLAACPMALPAEHGAHAPCHSDGDHDATTTRRGHDCCAWVMPSSTSGKFFIQKNSQPFGDLASDTFATAVVVAWYAPPLARPPPIPVPPEVLRPAIAGGDTFLRTGRLRL